MPGLEQLERFVKETRRRHVPQQDRQIADGGGSLRRDAEVQLGGQARRAKHPDGIFAISGHRVADQPQRAAGDIFHAARVVPDAEVGNVVVERIDREIPAPDVFVDGAVDVIADDPAGIGVLPVVCRAAGRRPEGDNLDHIPPEMHMGQAESPANEAAVSEQRANLFRLRVCRDIEVLGFAAHQQVTDPAADDKRLMTGTLEAVENLERVTGDIRPAERVVRTAYDHRGRDRLTFRPVKWGIGANLHGSVIASRGSSVKPARLVKLCAGQV